MFHFHHWFAVDDIKDLQLFHYRHRMMLHHHYLMMRHRLMVDYENEVEVNLTSFLLMMMMMRQSIGMNE
jgi:hypothetical protein